MANENTAIHDLLAGLQRKPLDQDPDDDVLFAGSRREQAGLRRAPRGTEPPPNLFAMPAPPPVAGPLPPAQLAVSLPYGQVHAQMATSRVARTNKKIYFIPAGLAVVAAVLVAILMGGKDEKPAKIAASAAPAEQPAQLALEAAKQVPPPSVTPIAEPAPAVPAAIVTPIEPAAAPAAATGELPNDAVAPPEVVPASAFVAGGATVETVPTVPAGLAKTETAPAPEAVAETAPEKAEKAPKAKTKSRRELAREKRAAKRAGKRTTKRETKQVARAEPAEKAGKLNGNGALAVSSSQPREVWVDGRNSKRMTPLRVLLKPGKHKVTLFDKEHGTAKTFEVDIKPDTTTKVSK